MPTFFFIMACMRLIQHLSYGLRKIRMHTNYLEGRDVSNSERKRINSQNFSPKKDC